MTMLWAYLAVNYAKSIDLLLTAYADSTYDASTTYGLRRASYMPGAYGKRPHHVSRACRPATHGGQEVTMSLVPMVVEKTGRWRTTARINSILAAHCNQSCEQVERDTHQDYVCEGGRGP